MDKQDSKDDMHTMSQKFQSITTNERNLNMNEQTVNDSTMSKYRGSITNAMINENRMKISLDNSWRNKDLPGKNLPEKIVFVVDSGRESDCTPFETRTGAKYSPLYMIKRVIDIFVKSKSRIEPKHEYALVTLEANGVSWKCNFTDSPWILAKSLDKIEEDHIDPSQSSYNLGDCFELLCTNTNFERNSAYPLNVSRVVLIYARSHVIPLFLTGKNYLDRLSENSHFYLDSLYVHETPSDDNKCQKIYEYLGKLDCNQTSFIFEAGRNLAALHTNMAKLLAHPLQRSRQDDSPYTVNNASSPQDVQTNV